MQGTQENEMLLRSMALCHTDWQWQELPDRIPTGAVANFATRRHSFLKESANKRLHRAVDALLGSNAFFESISDII